MKYPDCNNKIRLELAIEDSFVVVRQHEGLACVKVFMPVEQAIERRLTQ